MNDAMTLDLSELDAAGINLSYGLATIWAREAGKNKLLSALAAILKKEYNARHGKGCTQSLDAHIDLEEYAIDELTQTYAHFSTLGAAFQSSGHPSSARFCLQIVESISSALSSQQGAGHA